MMNNHLAFRIHPAFSFLPFSLSLLLGCSSEERAEVFSKQTTSENQSDKEEDSKAIGNSGSENAKPDGSGSDGSDLGTAIEESQEPDRNGDGQLNILLLGSSVALQSGAKAFSLEQVAPELESILEQDKTHSYAVNVVVEDIYQKKDVLLGLGQSGSDVTWSHGRHSLAQYYYWPEGREARLENLSGKGEVPWDHVVIVGDPNLIKELPGFYAFGVNLIADKVAESGAQPLLLMNWPEAADEAAIDHFSEFTARTADGAGASISLVPAGVAWGALSEEKRQQAESHPTPDGAYLSAAALYSTIFSKSAAISDYEYDDTLAEQAYASAEAEAVRSPSAKEPVLSSPFQSVGISDRILTYNQTGSSSERGIRGGLSWVAAQAKMELSTEGGAPLNFNYGRANTNFEPGKRYKIDADAYEVSLGFPMQDRGNHGDTSMLYGIDQRVSQSENGTDLGVAFYMVKNNELPQARALPIRSLYAKLKDEIPGQSAYRDAWHMHRDLDKAAGAFMFTLLTGHCALADEPEESDSDEWRSWMAHKVGYETAWMMMHLKAKAPGLRVIPESVESISVTSSQAAELLVSFASAPTQEVRIEFSVDVPESVQVTPSSLTFTPDDYQQPVSITLSSKEGGSADTVVLTASTQSKDLSFDGVDDVWEYALVP